MTAAQVQPVYYVAGRGPAPMRSTLKWAQNTLALLSPSQRNRVIRHAGKRAGLAWRATRARDRFDRRKVSRPPFNYRKGGRTPMFGARSKHDPAKMANAVYNGKVTCRVVANRDHFSVRVGLPKGHPVPPEITAVFLTATPGEVKEVAGHFQKAIESIQKMGGGAHRAIKVPGKRKPKYPEELNWRQRRAVGMKPKGRAR